MSSPTVERFQQEFADLLSIYLTERNEASLHAAYEAGRRALADGLGMLDVVAAMNRAMASACAAATSAPAAARLIGDVESPVLESLSPFEMSLRAVQESNAALRHHNEILEEETKRIAHQLHDAAGQWLASSHIALGLLEREVPQVRDRIADVRHMLGQVDSQIRSLSHELRPAMLDDLGLLPALRFLGDGVSARTGVEVVVAGERLGRLPPSMEVALYRIVQEAVSNAIRHGGASSIRILVGLADDRVHCAIHDDGVGMDGPRRTAGRGAPGLGLIGIRDRLASFGGALEIESRPGAGTTLRATIPLEGIHAASRLARR